MQFGRHSIAHCRLHTSLASFLIRRVCLDFSIKRTCFDKPQIQLAAEFVSLIFLPNRRGCWTMSSLIFQKSCTTLPLVFTFTFSFTSFVQLFLPRSPSSCSGGAKSTHHLKCVFFHVYLTNFR